MDIITYGYDSESVNHGTYKVCTFTKAWQPSNSHTSALNTQYIMNVLWKVKKNFLLLFFDV